MSARELARRSGVSQGYLSQLETGKNNNPTNDVLRKLAKGLGIPYVALMTELGYVEKDGSVKTASLQEAFMFDNIYVDKKIKLTSGISINAIINDALKGKDISYNQKKLSRNESLLITYLLNLIADKITNRKEPLTDEEIEKIEKDLDKLFKEGD